MAKTLLVCGYGSGIADAVAHRFGSEGFQVGIVARNLGKLATACQSLKDRGVAAEAFAADLGQPDATTRIVSAAREKLGPITALHWNVASGAAGDLLVADTDAIRSALDVAVPSLIAAVQAAYPDLKSERGAVLITTGGLGLLDPQMDLMAVRASMMGIAVANAAKHKLAGLLAERIKQDGIYVGEVIVAGLVKGHAVRPRQRDHPFERRRGQVLGAVHKA